MARARRRPPPPELQALAWLGRAHRVPHLCLMVFTIDRYVNAPWRACDDSIHGTLKTGTAVTPRGARLSFCSRDGAKMTVSGLGCDILPRIPANATALEERHAGQPLPGSWSRRNAY